jgi:hypothetical protein
MATGASPVACTTESPRGARAPRHSQGLNVDVTLAVSWFEARSAVPGVSHEDGRLLARLFCP